MVPYFVQLPLRYHDFHYESEDWYDMNKPPYRMPVPLESGWNRWMTNLIMINVYKKESIQWNGDFEQEMHLNMDLHGPHDGDGWLDIH